MSEPYDDLLADADEVIEHLSKVIERMKANMNNQRKMLQKRNADINDLCNERDTLDDRIVDLNTKLRTMAELEEQHLAELDRQSERIAELEKERALLFEAVGQLTIEAGAWEDKARHCAKVAKERGERISQLEKALVPEQKFDDAYGMLNH